MPSSTPSTTATPPSHRNSTPTTPKTSVVPSTRYRHSPPTSPLGSTPTSTASQPTKPTGPPAISATPSTKTADRQLPPPSAVTTPGRRPNTTPPSLAPGLQNSGNASAPTKMSGSSPISVGSPLHPPTRAKLTAASGTVYGPKTTHSGMKTLPAPSGTASATGNRPTNPPPTATLQPR